MAALTLYMAASVLNLHYHGDQDQDISGEEEENVEEAEV